MNVIHKFMPLEKKLGCDILLCLEQIFVNIFPVITMCVDAEKSEVHAGIFIWMRYYSEYQSFPNMYSVWKLIQNHSFLEWIKMP